MNKKRPDYKKQLNDYNNWRLVAKPDPWEHLEAMGKYADHLEEYVRKLRTILSQVVNTPHWEYPDAESITKVLAETKPEAEV